MLLKLSQKAPNWLLICLVVSINLWSLVIIDLKVYQYMHLVMLVFFVYSRINKNGKWYGYSNKLIIAMMVLPLPSIYMCYALHGQAISQSIIIYRMHLAWLVYFVLIKKRVSEKKVIKAIAIIGFIAAIISIVEQFTFPAFAPFGVRTIYDGIANYADYVEERFGFLRFMVSGIFYVVITFFCVLSNNLKIQFKVVSLFLLFVAIFAYGTKSTILSVIVGISYYLLFTRNYKLKFLYFILIVVLMGILVVGSQQIADMLNISFLESYYKGSRMFSYIYYWNDYTKNPLVVLFGNGLGHQQSVYGASQDSIWIGRSLAILSDTGLLRSAYFWGALYVLAYIIMMIRLVLNKNLDIAYKAIIISKLFALYISSPLWEIEGMMGQAIFVYLCDRNIKKNTKKISLMRDNCYYGKRIL